MTLKCKNSVFNGLEKKNLLSSNVTETGFIGQKED